MGHVKEKGAGLALLFHGSSHPCLSIAQVHESVAGLVAAF